MSKHNLETIKNREALDVLINAGYQDPTTLDSVEFSDAVLRLEQQLQLKANKNFYDRNERKIAAALTFMLIWASASAFHWADQSSGDPIVLVGLMWAIGWSCLFCSAVTMVGVLKTGAIDDDYDED